MKQDSIFLQFARSILFVLIRTYQKTLSALSIGSCRYYPSCSEYALWLLPFEHPFFALFKIMLRILTCNQFFDGGIAYPKACVKLRNITFAPKKIKYWLIPITNKNFFAIMQASKIYTMRVYIIKSLSQR